MIIESGRVVVDVLELGDVEVKARRGGWVLIGGFDTCRGYNARRGFCYVCSFE